MNILHDFVYCKFVQACFLTSAKKFLGEWT